MTYRRPPKPSPARDFRALAADRPQRALPLPVLTSADTVPDAVLEPMPDDLDLRLRTDAVGRFLTLSGSTVFRRADEARDFAARVLAGARAMEDAP